MPSVSGRISFQLLVYKCLTVYLTELAVQLTWPSLYSTVTGLLMLPFFLFESPWLLCAVTVHALHVLALLNTVNYSMVVDQSDNSISTILHVYNNNYHMHLQQWSSGLPTVILSIPDIWIPLVVNVSELMVVLQVNSPDCCLPNELNMIVLVYLVVLSIRGFVGENATPSGAVHTTFTVNPTSTYWFSSTAQITVTLDPGVMGLDGLLETVTVGSGTARKSLILELLCNVSIIQSKFCAMPIL